MKLKTIIFESVGTSLSRYLEKKYPQTNISLTLMKPNILVLSAIIVIRQNEGVGTKIMNDILNFADQHKYVIALTPDTAYGGTSISRLTSFYKRFGFIKNADKNKNFYTKNTMIRDPK